MAVVAEGLDLAVGDVAVFAGHGVARVTVRLSRDIGGESCEFVVFGGPRASRSRFRSTGPVRRFGPS
jgi:hypothetical protein